jgi:hypothetical protein
MTTVRARARIATTHAISAYGGIQLDLGVMRGIASALRSGTIPMHFNHDRRRPLTARSVDAGVERLEDGHYAVWAEFDVDASIWDEWQNHLSAAGVKGGMSFSLTAPLDDEEGGEHIFIAADAAHFEDAVIRSAAAVLTPFGNVQPQRYYQFAAEPAPVVVIGFLLSSISALGPDLVAAALWDAIKVLWRGRKRDAARETKFVIEAREAPSERTLSLIIESSDERSLKTAIEKGTPLFFEGLAGTFDFDTRSGGYTQVSVDGKDRTEGKP